MFRSHTFINRRRAPPLAWGALHEDLCIRKPGSVPRPDASGRLSVICLVPPSPMGSIDLPARTGRATLHPDEVGDPWPIWSFSPRGLPCRSVRTERGGLLPHRFTLALRPSPQGGLFSVALSVARPSLAGSLPVRKRGALCCPDFPPPGRIRGATERCTGCQGTGRSPSEHRIGAGQRWFNGAGW